MRQLPTLPKMLAFAITVFLLCLLLISLFSCTSQKHIQQASRSTDTATEANWKDSSEYKTKEIERLEQRLRESEYAEVQFDTVPCPDIRIPDCPAMLNKDTVLNLVARLNQTIAGLQNKVTFFKDGTVEYAGKLKSFKYANEKQSEQISELSHESDSLKRIIANLKTESHEVVKVKEVQKTVRWTPWWLFALCIAAGAFLWAKLGKPIQSFINHFKEKWTPKT